MKQTMSQHTIPNINRRLLRVGLVLSCFLMGCSAVQQSTGTPRSITEQMLLNQAIERGLDQAVLPLNPQTTLALDAIGLAVPPEVGANSDINFAKGIIDGWLRAQGYRVLNSKKGFKVRIVIQTFGTQQSESFVGIPQISSSVIPFALPELALYKASRQMSLARFKLEILDQDSGRLVHATPFYQGIAYLNQYVLFFGFTFRTTDLTPPPPEA